MIFDSQEYNGTCVCGKEHKSTTLFCIVESGCLRDIDTYTEKYGLTGFSVAVYDENTYAATKDRHPNARLEVVLPAEDLHADEHGVELLSKRLPKETQVLIAIGSGTIHDIVRYCAYTRNIEFVSCPTAASVDGFCSSMAAMTWHGCKKTFTAVAPKLVVADIDIIKNAPIRLTRSGFGDMIGKYVALCDWKIGNLLTGEAYCETIADITLTAVDNVVQSAAGIAAGDAVAYEKLMYGLLMSGIAMQLLGYSRPASGAEHHISHFIEMNPPVLGKKSDALHGEKVGVGTLLAIREYKRLISLQPISFKDYIPFSADLIQAVFGKDLSDGVLEENRDDAAADVTADTLLRNWDRICREIEKLPDAERLKEFFIQLGLKSTLSDIGVSDITDALLSYSPMVRNRLTFMRIRKCVITDERDSCGC